MSQTPPLEPGSPGDWILGEQLALPRQALAPEEAEASLEWLLSAVARRPKRLDLREGTGVARYLRGLTFETPLRRQVERIAEVIWRTILACAPFDAAGQREVLEFLDEHAETYLVPFDVAAVRERVSRGGPPAHLTPATWSRRGCRPDW